jgi:hypothetical protein
MYFCKERFRTLKFPSRFHRQARVGDQSKACCVLHNMLHKHDRLGIVFVSLAGHATNLDDEALELLRVRQERLFRAKQGELILLRTADAPDNSSIFFRIIAIAFSSARFCSSTSDWRPAHPPLPLTQPKPAD